MKKIIASLLSLMLLTAATVMAEEASIELRSTSEVEVEFKNEKGEKEIKRVKASEAKVVPGDTVIFSNHYSYKGSDPAENIVITNPISEHTVYVDFSAEGKGTSVDFSVDGGKTFDSVAELKIIDAEGNERRALASDYTHVRWTFDKALQKGDKGNVSFRAKIK